MGQKQPYLLGYLMAVEQQLMEKKARGSILLLGFIVWHIMSKAAPHLRQIGPEELETAEEANILRLEQMNEDSEMNFRKATLELFSTYNQMPLLGIVLEALMHDFEEAPEMMDDRNAMALLHLKSVIDCLDQ